MKLIALMLARNEAWTLPASVRACLRWCDGIVMLNHCSTDDTGEVLSSLQCEFGDRVKILEEREPLWREMNHRQRTLDAARAMGATHCAIVDADEVLSENLVGSIRGRIESLEPGEVLQIPWVILWRSLDLYRSDPGIWSSAYISFAFRDSPELHWEPRENGYHHHHRHPMQSTHRKEGILHEGGLLHFQHANWRRLAAKQALYQVNEVLHYPAFTREEIRARYAGTVDETGLERVPVPAAWWGPEKGLIRLDESPWQETEVRRLVALHGRESFDGINLLGVA